MSEENVFQQRLKKAMQQQKLRQVDLVNLTGIGKSAINQYLKGVMIPKQEKLQKIADALNVSTSWLLGTDKKDAEKYTNYFNQEWEEAIKEAVQLDGITIYDKPQKNFFQQKEKILEIYFDLLPIQHFDTQIASEQFSKLLAWLYAIEDNNLSPLVLTALIPIIDELNIFYKHLLKDEPEKINNILLSFETVFEKLNNGIYSITFPISDDDIDIKITPRPFPTEISNSLEEINDLKKENENSNLLEKIDNLRKELEASKYQTNRTKQNDNQRTT